MTKPVLVLPNLMKPFEVNCDASGECLGAVLLQEGHAIEYESRCFHPQEQVLGIYEKELLVVMHALDSWKHYLLGNPFIIQMDHQSLKYFMTQTKLSDKQMRWANFISQFHFHIAHILGKQSLVANALSQRPRVNAISIAYHNDLSSMIDAYGCKHVNLYQIACPWTLLDSIYHLPFPYLVLQRIKYLKIEKEQLLPTTVSPYLSLSPQFVLFLWRALQLEF